MKKLVMILAIALTGCGSWCTKHDVVIQHDYEVRTAPEELYQIPAYPKPLNLDSATQADVAQWIISNEQRTYKLENQLKGLKDFYTAPVK